MTQDDILQVLELRIAALESVVQVLISSHPDRDLVDKVAGAALAGLSSGATKAGVPQALVEEAREHWGTMLQRTSWPGRRV